MSRKKSIKCKDCGSTDLFKIFNRCEPCYRIMTQKASTERYYKHATYRYRKRNQYQRVTSRKSPTPKAPVYRPCQLCAKDFKTSQSIIDRGSGKYCSDKCFRQYRSDNAKLPIALRRKVTPHYQNVHYWIRKELGRPNKCEFCKTTEAKFEWSNKSGKYLYDLSDWQRLCTTCHRKYDKSIDHMHEIMYRKYGMINPKAAHKQKLKELSLE